MTMPKYTAWPFNLSIHSPGTRLCSRRMNCLTAWLMVGKELLTPWPLLQRPLAGNSMMSGCPSSYRVGGSLPGIQGFVRLYLLLPYLLYLGYFLIGYKIYSCMFVFAGMSAWLFFKKNRRFFLSFAALSQHLGYPWVRRKCHSYHLLKLVINKIRSTIGLLRFNPCSSLDILNT